MIKWPWVSRDSLVEAEHDAEVHRKAYDRQFTAHDKTRQQRDDFKRQLDLANAKLKRIAAMETPNCASIGRRMAAVARGEG